MGDPRVIRVFISSPADVRPERVVASRVVARLAREFSYYFQVEAVLWEREPMLASHHFQDLITPPRDTDVVVVLLWSRLGLPLPDEPRWYGPLSGRRVTGTEWEFEDALAGYRQEREPRRPDLLLYRKRAEVMVPLGDPAAFEEQRRQADLVEDFMRRWFRDVEGVSATASSRSFAAGADLEAMLEEHLRELLRKRLDRADRGEEAATIRWHHGSPYRGLEAFEPEHEQIFFGRRRARNEVRELLARQAARGNAFVLVMGASGSGKSSLVKAGVLPQVREAGVVGNAALVRYAITRPGAGGNMASRLAADLLGETALPELAAAPLAYDADGLARLLVKTPEELVQPIRQGLLQAGFKAGVTGRGEARLLLVVDQLEELFTAEGVTAEDRTRYVAALAALARSGLVWVIATMRSDFFDRLERLPALADLAGGEAKYVLTAPGVIEVEQIIVQPAREAGLRFEEQAAAGRRLDATIREAAASEAGSLPLLEYLLDQLWQRRTDKGLLTFKAYEKLGGLEGAIGRRADDVLVSQPPEVQATLPRVLRALVTIRQGARGAVTARYARISQFTAGSPARRLVDVLTAPDARLLVPEGDTIRVAHEALLRQWPRAAAQIAEDRSDLQLRARLEEQAVRWQGAEGKDRESLLLATGLPLSEAEDLLGRRREELEPTLVGYIEGSAAVVRSRQRRATRRLQAIAAVLALLALGAGVGAWFGFTGQREAQLQEAEARQRRDQAEDALQRAEANLGQALKLVDAIMTDTVGRFEQLGMPKAEAKALLDRVQPVLDTLQRGQTSGALSQRRFEILFRLGDLYMALGDVDAALKHCRAALALASEQATLDPASIQWQRRVSGSQDRIGDVLMAQGDLAGALKAYQESLEVRRGVALRDPVTIEWQRDLALSQDRVGDVLMAQGDLASALRAYEEGLKIRQRLALRDPLDAELQRDLALSQHRIGNVLMAQGDLAGALKAYQRSLEITQRLARRDPANTRWQRDVSVGHDRVGDALMAQGDLTGALQAYQESLEIRQRLARRDPSNTDWQHGVSVSQHKIGNVLIAQGNVAGALQAYQESLEISQRLVRSDPSNTAWQRDMSVSQERLGDALLAEGALPRALKAYRESIEIRQGLVRRDPANTGWQRDLSVSQHKLGNALMVEGDLAGALTVYQESLEISQRLVRRDPVNIEWQRDVAWIQERLGDALTANGDLAGALKAYGEGLQIRQGLVRRDPANTRWQRDVATSLSRIAVTSHRLGERPAAIDAARAGQAIIMALLKQWPDHPQLKLDAEWFAAKLKELE